MKKFWYQRVGHKILVQKLPSIYPSYYLYSRAPQISDRKTNLPGPFSVNVNIANHSAQDCYIISQTYVRLMSDRFRHIFQSFNVEYSWLHCMVEMVNNLSIGPLSIIKVVVEWYLAWIIEICIWRYVSENWRLYPTTCQSHISIYNLMYI